MNVFTNGTVSIVQTQEQFVIVEGERISHPFSFDQETIHLLKEVISTKETVTELKARWIAENKVKREAKSRTAED